MLYAAGVVSLTTSDAAHATTTTAGVHPQVLATAFLDHIQVLMCHCTQGFSSGFRRCKMFRLIRIVADPAIRRASLPLRATPHHGGGFRLQPKQLNLVVEGPGTLHLLHGPKLGPRVGDAMGGRGIPVVAQNCAKDLHRRRWMHEVASNPHSLPLVGAR